MIGSGGGGGGGGLWLSPNPSKRWGELFFLFYTPFWLTLSLGIVVPYKLYEVQTIHEMLFPVWLTSWLSLLDLLNSIDGKVPFIHVLSSFNGFIEIWRLISVNNSVNILHSQETLFILYEMFRNSLLSVVFRNVHFLCQLPDVHGVGVSASGLGFSSSRSPDTHVTRWKGSMFILPFTIGLVFVY